MSRRILRVYADEAGTMPQADDALPFVCACVGFLGQLRRPQELEGRPGWLLQYLKANGGIPHVCFIQPAEGYSAALHDAHRVLERMALVTRATTGANRKFVPEMGISLANHTWGKAMTIAIGQLVTTAAASGPVDRLVIILDQKTMKPETRQLFRHITGRVGVVLRDELLKLKRRDLAAASYINGNIRFKREDIELRWSDELRKDPFGLRIADLLARFAWQHLSKSASPGFLDDLKGLSDHSCVLDITNVMSTPLPEEEVRRWEQDHGHDQDDPGHV